MSLPIALQLYSVRDDLAADFYGTLKKVKEMGYEGVEFAGLHGNDPEQVKKWCEEIRLDPISAHIPFVDLLRNPIGVLQNCVTLGFKYVVFHYFLPEHRSDQHNLPYVMEYINTISKAAKPLGVTMLYHNHDFEFMKYEGEYALDVLYSKVPADLLQTEIDTCWAKVAGVDPAEYVRKYSGRSPLVHLKDFYGERDDNMYELIGIDNKPVRPKKFELRPVGHGLQDVPAILEAAKEAKSEWVVVEQDTPSMGLTPMECAKKSIDYLKSFEW